MNHLVEEINGLSEILGWPLKEDWQDIIQPFNENWPIYTEYQISMDSGVVDLITLGKGDPYLDAIENQMISLGIDQSSLSTFQSMRRYAYASTWGLKLSITGDQEIQVYVKKPLPLEEVVFWLSSQNGINENDATKMRLAAKILERSHTHFVGADYSYNKSPRYQVYFTQYVYGDEPVEARLTEAAGCLGFAEDIGLMLARYHPLLAQDDQTIWLSIGLKEGRILPTIKLDYAGIRLGLVSLVLEDIGADNDQYIRLQNAVRYLGVDTANYFGLRLAAATPPQLSLYFTRVNKGLN